MKHERPAKRDVELDALLADWRDDGMAAAGEELPGAMARALARAPSPARGAAGAEGVVVELPRRQRALATVLLLAAAISGLFVGSSTSVLSGDDATSSDGTSYDVASFDYGATLSWTGE